MSSYGRNSWNSARREVRHGGGKTPDTEDQYDSDDDYRSTRNNDRDYDRGYNKRGFNDRDDSDNNDRDYNDREDNNGKRTNRVSFGQNDRDYNNDGRRRNDEEFPNNSDDRNNIVLDVRNRFRKLIQDSNVVSTTSFWPSGKKKAAMKQIGLKFRSNNHRKEVTVQEFQHALVSLYQQTGGSRRSLTASDMNQVIRAIDTDNDGKVSFSELISFVTFESRELRAVARNFARGLRARGESARSIFEQVASGRYVDIKKFTSFLRLKQMTDLSVDETSTLMKWFDTNGDGKVDVAEFASFLED
jgi:Ca2+-binding EF-hand superfamily protein